MTGQRLRAVPYGRAALDALSDAIVHAKAGDPLAPVTVVPPNVYAGLSLRRALARRGGLVNTSFMPLDRVAELLGGSRLAAEGRRPLTATVRQAAIRAVLHDEPGLFADVATSPAAADALDAEFREMRTLTGAALDDLAAQGPRAAEVVRLFRAWSDRVPAFYDETDLARAAAVAVRAGAAAARDLGSLVLHLPAHLGPAEHELVEAIAAADRLHVILGTTGDTEADTGAWRLAERLKPALGDVEPAETAAPVAPTRVVVAPTPEEEVRAVARGLLDHVRAGVPLHRVALVARSLDAYGLTALDVFTEAGLPCHGPSPRTLAHTVAGRVLAGAVALPDNRFARAEVVAWLQSGPILDRAGEAVPADRWDRRSRQAGVTAGPAQWRARLEGLAARLGVRRRETLLEGDETSADRLARAVDEIGELRAFVDDLVRRLRPPREAAWQDHCSWAAGVLSLYLGGETAHAPWPDHEIEALRHVEAALDALAALDDVEPSPDPATFRRALDHELRVPVPRTTTFGDGVFVGRVGDLAGTDVDVVYVLGMAEGAFPARMPPGLLSDNERAAMELPGPDARRADERRDFLAALAAGATSVLLVPAADPRAGRERHAAPWLLEAAGRLHGGPVYAESLVRMTGEPWLDVFHSPEDALRRASDPASESERDLVDLLAAADEGGAPGAHPLVSVVPELGRGIESSLARAGPLTGPWAGAVGPLGDHVGDRTLSPTSLETWATCAFRYLLGSLLEVEELDEPEEIETLAPKDRGLLVHEILEILVRELGPSLAPGEGWTETAHRRLDEIADERFAEWEARGRTGRAVLWELEQRRLRSLLHRFLDVEAEVRAELGVAPVATELAFTDGGEGVLEVRLDDGRQVRMRGYIDRVDAAPDGSRLRVVDYKTGKPISASLKGNPFEDDRFVGGTKLQLAAYALAARRHFGSVPTVAEYWYLSERWRFKREGYEVTDEVIDEFRDVLSRIVTGIEAGLFPARPGEEIYHPLRGGYTYAHCAYCPYDRVCPVDRADAWERHRSDPALQGYTSLSEAPE